MSYFVFCTLSKAGVFGIVPITVPLRLNTQLAPAGLVLTVISCEVPSNIVAQPVASSADPNAIALAIELTERWTTLSRLKSYMGDSDNLRYKAYERLLEVVNVVGRIMARWERLS